jgi:hypothetical protein
MVRRLPFTMPPARPMRALKRLIRFLNDIPKPVHITIGNEFFNLKTDPLDQAVDCFDGFFKRAFKFRRYMIIGFNRKVFFLKNTIAKMILIRFRLPFLHHIHHVGHIGDHFEQHHHFVKVVQIVSCQQRLTIDGCAFGFGAKLLIGFIVERRDSAGSGGILHDRGIMMKGRNQGKLWFFLVVFRKSLSCRAFLGILPPFPRHGPGCM